MNANLRDWRKNSTSAERESVKYWKIPQLRGVDLLRASYVTQTFARHTHDGYAVGVVERGALGFAYRGETLVASPGTVNLVIPGEAHTGFPASEQGWAYRMFYLDASLMEEAASQLADRRQAMPVFRAGVIHDPHLALALGNLHRSMEDQADERLTMESLFLLMLGTWIARHAEDPPVVPCFRAEHRVVRVAREYLESHFSDPVSLDALSAIAGMSAFHLVRVFQRELGLPPHAYLTQMRVERAKGLIARGRTLAETAVETGFVDQSHLTRHFKRILGMTPGQYRNFLQDRS